MSQLSQSQIDHNDDNSATVVLITGFDAFDRQSINPSWEAVKALADWCCQGASIKTQLLPCVFGKAITVLEQAITAVNPAIVLCVGQAGGRSGISIERVAINIDDARIADNAGEQPIDHPVVNGAPAAYFSNLPIKAIVHQLRAAGIPAAVSNTAGTFVCNHLFYGLMHHLATRALVIEAQTTEPKTMRGGFIHIPYLPEQVAQAGTQPADAPSMALATMVRGLQIAIQTSLSLEKDIIETGGHLN